MMCAYGDNVQYIQIHKPVGVKLFVWFVNGDNMQYIPIHKSAGLKLFVWFVNSKMIENNKKRVNCSDNLYWGYTEIYQTIDVKRRGLVYKLTQNSPEYDF